MNDAIRAAREHNTRALIHRSLSNENISDIFLALAVLDTPSLASPQGWLLQVNGVCHLWREIALNSPELWARSAGSFLSERMTDLAIERARAVDLSLDGHYEDYERHVHVLSDYQLLLIEKHVAHLRSFVHDDYRDWSELLYRLKSFPKLVFARIWDEAGPDMWCESIEAPSLQSLYVNNAFIPFIAPALRYLRLDMDYIDWRRDPYSERVVNPEACEAIPRVFPTYELISFLKRSPYMERLIITDMPVLLSKHLPTISELHVNLPRLRALHLGGKSWAMSDLWQRLMVPPEAQVFIDTENSPMPGKRDEWDLSLLEAVRDRLVLPVYDSMRLGMTPSYDLLLQTWSSPTHGVLSGLSLSESLGLGDPKRGPAFTLRLPVGTREMLEQFLDYDNPLHTLFNDIEDPSLRFQDTMSMDFHGQTNPCLTFYMSPTLKYLDLTDLPFARQRALDRSSDYVGRLSKPSADSGAAVHVLLNWSLVRQLSVKRLVDHYIQDSVKELTIVDFPCAAFPSPKRYGKVTNENAWKHLYGGLEARHTAGYPPLSLRLAESTSETSNMERSAEPEYVHTIEGSYEDAVKAVTEKGYQLIAPFVTSFEDLRVHSWP
ncbi:hypothetical protein PENSPDRAFT_749997 [Peniophora sp. CONT]|nr:hypothetical protein PENSPDRAFT_749997 [Peniophora sp. CONT]